MREESGRNSADKQKKNNKKMREENERFPLSNQPN